MRDFHAGRGDISVVRCDNLRQMPIYEYDCDACGHRFEKLVQTDDAVACPECQSDKVTKRFSVFASNGGDSAPPAPT